MWPRRHHPATRSSPRARPNATTYGWSARWIEEEAPSFYQASRENPDAAEDLAGELATPRYEHDSSGRIVVESKPAMKKRGMPSPDLADGLLLTFDDFHPEGAGIASAGRRRF